MSIAPKYVQIYNQILNRIEHAEYSHKIPSEKQLAQDFNCSRVTIRSALALLKEDQVIYSIKGEGHFIKHANSLDSTGIEVNCSLFQSSCNVSIDNMVFEISHSKATAYSQKLFDNTDDYRSFNIWFESNHQIVGNEFSMVTMSAINHNVDIYDQKEVKRFINHDIYKQAAHIQINMQQSQRKANTFHQEFFTDNEPMIMIEENLNDKNGQTFAQNKYYLPLKFLNVRLNKYWTK